MPSTPAQKSPASTATTTAPTIAFSNAVSISTYFPHSILNDPYRYDALSFLQQYL